MQIRTEKYGELTEIVAKTDDGQLIAVIDHPCPGAKWFLHRAGKYHTEREKYRTRKAAIAAL